MPVYDYKCREHGLFYGLAKLEDSDKPANCTICGALAPRVIMIPPNVLNMPEEKKHAHETNERNQHEPTVSTKDRRAYDEVHQKGCGCEKTLSKSKLMYTARGEKMFPSMRPWMISH